MCGAMGDEERRAATQDARGSRKRCVLSFRAGMAAVSSRLSQSLLSPSLACKQSCRPGHREKDATDYHPRRNMPTAKFGVAFSLFQLNSGSDVWRCLITRRLRASKGGIFATETGTVAPSNMAARLARWEESRRRNALKQQRQPQHVTTDVGRHDLFAQPHKQSSPIKDPFARPPLQLEPTDEQLGQPRLRRPRSRCQPRPAARRAGPSRTPARRSRATSRQLTPARRWKT